MLLEFIAIKIIKKGETNPNYPDVNLFKSISGPEDYKAIQIKNPCVANFN